VSDRISNEVDETAGGGVGVGLTVRAYKVDSAPDPIRLN
jgi:hypothetical protein